MAVKQYGLLVLPGFLMLLQKRIGIILLPVVLLITCIIIASSMKINGTLLDWHMPAIVVLLIEIRLSLILVFDIHGAENVMDLMFVVFTILGLVVFLRLKKHISLHTDSRVYIPITILIAVVLLYSCLNVTNSFFIFFLNWSIKVIPVLSLGLIFSLKKVTSSILLLITSEALWLNMYLAPESVAYSIWNSSDVQTRIAYYAIQVLPTLLFLILIPLITLFLINSPKREWWILISTFFSISVIVFLDVFFLHNLSRCYIMIAWVKLTVALWLPLVLGVALYSSLENTLNA